MISEIPNEIWEIIVRQATIPDDAATLEGPECDIAKLFDPNSIGDQSRHPWRKDFKHPIDTPTSIGTKLALMRVSHRFYDLSRRYHFENLYFYETDIARLRNLQVLLTQRLPDGISTTGSLVKNIYILIACGTPMQDIWVDSMIATIQQSTSLQGFFLLISSSHDIYRTGAASRFWKARISKIAQSVPSCISHFEWSFPPSWISNETVFPAQEIVEIFRRARGLRAIRICEQILDLPLGDDITLPELQYLDIHTSRHNMYWQKFSSLTHVAFNARLIDPTQHPELIHATLPYLSYLCLGHYNLQISAGFIRDMLAAAPNLHTLVCLRRYPIPREHELWTLARSSSLQRFEIHLRGSFDLDMLYGHALPFADPQNFPAFACFKLCGLQYIHSQPDEDLVETDAEMVNRALPGLPSRGIQVLVEPYPYSPSLK